MNILEQIQGVVNSDLGKTFLQTAFPQPQAMKAPVSTINPIDQPKDYTPWIIGGVSVLVLVISMIFLRSKKK